MPSKNWKEIYKKYQGKWVALEDDEITVISSGATAQGTLSKAQQKGYKNPILTHMPDELTVHTAHHQ